MSHGQDFAELMKKYRKQFGWNQKALAERMGVHRNTISNLETRDRLPNKQEVLQLAKEFQLEGEEWKEFLIAAGLKGNESSEPLWNIPHNRNPFFTGREAIFSSLWEKLAPGRRTRAIALTQTISGLGGIGKTQVAVEYAYRYANKYDGVLWLPADSLETFTSACLQLATGVLGLPEQQEAPKQVEAVKHWLQTHHGWLLILDNVEKPQEVLPKLLPTMHQGSVLITTRIQGDLGTLAQIEVLPVFSRYEGVLFLLRRARKIPQQANVRKAMRRNILLAKRLYHLLGGLPLALDQAGAYIAENKCSLQRYIDLYEQYRPQLLDRRGEIASHPEAGDHPDSVLVTFWLSWERIQKQNVLAGKALQFCAFLAPDQIPEQLLLAGITPSETESISDVLEMDEALGLLYRYSLVERAEQMLSLHRLVQEVIQSLLSEEEQCYWIYQSIHVINASSPDVKDTKQWDVCERWLPHALVCAHWIEEKHFTNLDAAHLLNEAGVYLEDRVRYSEAEWLYQRALAITQQQLGTNHPKVTLHLNNLASLYWHQGKYSEAELLLVRVLTIYLQQVELDHSHIAQTLNNLAVIYNEQGKYIETEQLYLQVLAVYERLFGSKHREAAATLGNLANLYERQGEYTKAEALFQRAIEIDEQLLGNDHPSVAMHLNNFANLYAHQGKYTEAEQLYQRALAVYERLFGGKHREAATTLGNLANLYERRGEYTKAEALFQRAIEIAEQLLGTNHPLTAMLSGNLADTYRVQKKYVEAERFYLQTLTILDQKLGSNHPHTAVSLDKLAALYSQQGRHEEAERLLKRAVKVSLVSLGTEHPQARQIVMNYLALLSYIHPDADSDTLLRLLAQRKQESDDERERSLE